MHLSNILFGITILDLLAINVADNPWTCHINTWSKVYAAEGSVATIQYSVAVSSFGQLKVDSFRGLILNAIYSSSQNNLKFLHPEYTFVGNLTAGNINIVITSMNLSYAGSYSSYWEIVLNGSTNCTTLYLLGKPRYTAITNNSHFVQGREETLTCSSESTTYPNNHSLAFVYDWKVDEQINPNSNYFYPIPSRQTLRVRNVSKEDSFKKFSCRATEVVTGGLPSDWSSQRSFVVYYGPDILCANVSSVLEFTEGDNISIGCFSDCFPSCNYTWSNEGGTLSNNEVLFLSKIRRRQSGNYNFTAQGFAKSTRRTFQIIVKYAPVVHVRFSTPDRSEGSSLVLFCEGEGVPATYTYTALTQTVGQVEVKNGDKALDGTTIYSSIQFRSLQLQDTGNYTCKINNGIRDLNGTLDQTVTVQILVEVQPKILREDLLFVGLEGGNVTVKVPFYCYPAVQSVTFATYNGTEIKNTGKYKISFANDIVYRIFYGKNVSLNGFQAYMTINHFVEEDFGNYTLTIQNSKGSNSVKVLVTSEGNPSVPKHFQFILSITGPSFTWEKGFNGGHTQTFVIQVSPLGSGTWMNFTKVKEDDNRYKINQTFYTITITGLQPGQYTARLIAENSKGLAEPLALGSTFTISSEEGGTGQRSQLIGGVAGGTVSALAVIALAVFIVAFLRKRRAGKSEKETSPLQLSKSGSAVKDDSSDGNDAEVENPMYVSAGHNTEKDSNVSANKMQPKIKSPQADVYAVVDKSKAAVKKRRGKQTKPKLGEKGDIYENAPEKSPGGNMYGNAGCEGKTYEATDVSINTNTKNENTVGLVYVDLVFSNEPKGNKKQHDHVSDERTPYAQVDFQRSSADTPSGQLDGGAK